MSENEVIVIVVGFVLFLVGDFMLFRLEYLRLEKQHNRHKQEIEELFAKYLKGC